MSAQSDNWAKNTFQKQSPSTTGAIEMDGEK